MYIFLIIIFIVTCLTRFPFIGISSSDRFTQMWVIKNAFYYSGNKHRDCDTNSLMKGDLLYPLFPALLIRKFPEKYWIVLGTFFNFLGDVFSAFLIFFLVSHDGTFSYFSSFLVSIFWSTLPILHPVNARLVGIGARGIAPFFYFLFFLSMEKIVIEPSLVIIAINIFAGFFIILCSQFGLQALIFTCIGLGLFLNTFTPIIIVFSIISISIFIPGFSLKKQLKGKLLHYQWYWLHGRKFIGKRNNLIHFFKLFKGNPFSALIYFFTSFTPVIVFVGFSGIILFFTYLYIDQPNIFDNDFNKYYLAIFLSSLIVSTLTVIGPLVIFGESERYLEYSSVFIVLLFTSFLDNDLIQSLLPLFVLLNLVFLFLNLNLFKLDEFTKALFPSADPELQSIIEKLDKRKVITSPITFSSVLAYYDRKPHRQNKYLNHLVFNDQYKLSHWPSGNAIYPAIELNKDLLIQKFQVDTVVVQKKWVNQLSGSMNPENLLYQSSVETDNYKIYFLT